MMMTFLDGFLFAAGATSWLVVALVFLMVLMHLVNHLDEM